MYIENFDESPVKGDISQRHLTTERFYCAGFLRVCSTFKHPLANASPTWFSKASFSFSPLVFLKMEIALVHCVLQMLEILPWSCLYLS